MKDKVVNCIISIAMHMKAADSHVGHIGVEVRMFRKKPLSLTDKKYTQQNNLRISKCVLPLFNTETYTFQILCGQGPFEIISR